MKTTKDEILLEALRLFAEKGFYEVSTGMIADRLGVTKGALYRHFENKQAIFDTIIAKMFELDAKQANDNNVPEKEYSENEDVYAKTEFGDLCGFVNEQYVFWTENEFACLFRRMITVEQYKSAEMRKLYQDVIALGPVNYTKDLFTEMIKNGQLVKSAEEIGAYNLALMLFAPLSLSIQLFDGGKNSEEIKENLLSVTKEFERKWKR